MTRLPPPPLLLHNHLLPENIGLLFAPLPKPIIGLAHILHLELDLIPIIQQISSTLMPGNLTIIVAIMTHTVIGSLGLTIIVMEDFSPFHHWGESSYLHITIIPMGIFNT